MSLHEDTRIALLAQPSAQKDSTVAPALDQFEADAKAPPPSVGGGLVLRRHRLSAAFPDLSVEEYRAMVESVRRDGLRDAIWTHEGEILDGWHRYRACREAGVEPRFREYEGDRPAHFVLSQQCARRNWTSSQAAAVAVDLEADLAEEAERRMRSGKDESGLAGGRGRRRNPRPEMDEGFGRAAQTPQETQGSEPEDVSSGGKEAPKGLIELAAEGVSLVDASPSSAREADAAPEPISRKAAPRTAPSGRDHKREIAGRSDQQAAEALGTNRHYVRSMRVIKKVDPALATQVRLGKSSVPQAERQLRERDAAERRREELARNVAASRHEPTLHCADFRDVVLDEGSVDAIVTDPPYPGEYLPLFGDLAEYAARVLKPGGVLLAMSGQFYLPEVYRLLGEHLTYVWTLGYVTPGPSSAIRGGRNARSNWKPVLLYSRGDYAGGWYSDYLSSTQAEKEHHHWGQNESGFATLIERFTRTDDLVLDPFLGGGTTGVAAVTLKRRFVGIEKDPIFYDKARGRLEGLARAADGGGTS